MNASASAAVYRARPSSPLRSSIAASTPPAPAPAAASKKSATRASGSPARARSAASSLASAAAASSASPGPGPHPSIASTRTLPLSSALPGLGIGTARPGVPGTEPTPGAPPKRNLLSSREKIS